MDDVQAATHIGICVSDLERSSRFYCDGLGFERVQALTAGDQFRRLMELEAEVVLEVQLLRRDGLTIELLWFRSPGSIGPRDRRPMNQLGFTHLSLRVANIDTVAKSIARLGGTVHAHTRTESAPVGGLRAGQYLYCSDPDGLRIELICRDGPLHD